VPTLPIPRELIDRLLAEHTDHAAEDPDRSSTGPTDEPAGDTTSRVHGDGERAEPGLSMSVWATAQAAPAAQRKGRYVPASTAHPAKMLPAIAAHAIAHYTQPGDLVLDPMCGIGTTLVEAVHLGRRAIGVEYEPRWVGVTEANLDLARHAGVDPDGTA
jgi:hypothetical protein